MPACDGQTDRQTDGQTDGFTIANTVLSIVSYAGVDSDLTLRHFLFLRPHPTFSDARYAHIWEILRPKKLAFLFCDCATLFTRQSSAGKQCYKLKCLPGNKLIWFTLLHKTAKNRARVLTHLGYSH